MKIIHILKGKANPNTMNGVNKVVHNLATEQLRLGLDVEVWGITATPSIIKHQHNYPLRLFPACLSRFGLAGSLWNGLKKLKTTTSLVHLHSVFLPELYSVSRLLKQSNIPWVLSPHSGYAPQSTKKNKLIKSIYMMLFEKKLITEAKKIHAIGASEVDDLFAIDHDLDIALVPNGQDFTGVQFEPETCPEPAERPIFGFCGRLAKEHKGLDLLIKGFSCYKKNKGKGELWLIGDGPDRRLLQDLVLKNHVQNSVTFLGPIFGNTKLNYFAAFDCFVHTSRWEGMPMAVLEAAALGNPLIISKETNMNEYVERYENGFVLPDNTPENISNAMIEFCKMYYTDKGKIMTVQSKRLIEEELNWTNITKSMVENLYYS
ncbi:hypothetical protein DGMP_07470 [Desulfomarina profundi]|uniref:Glycosyltransferase n=1 Tax=Desulfomarina profundi TaxID=2772557 RepID=A0A8D5FQS3_9BACT|nr:glycosyltransferase family 4 protein [Desulfomarina profundi]BCL60054.1 hypothetical protein DGMP_07470 [Desulfomarina profundi]